MPPSWSRAHELSPLLGRRLMPALLLTLLGLAALPGLAAPQDQADPTIDYVLQESWPLPAAPSAPVDLALGPEGLYAVDGEHNEVLAFDPQGRLRDRWQAGSEDEVLVPAAVAADPVRQRVYLLWMRFERQGGEAGGALRYLGLFLDTRRPDGSRERPLRSIGQIGQPSDLAVEPVSGDLFLTADGHVHRIDAESTWLEGSIEVGDTSGPAGQIALIDELHLALVRPLESAVQILTFEGIPVGRLDLGEHLPLAVAPDGAGGLQVMVRAFDPDDPSAPLVLRFDAERQPAGRRSLAAMGAPSISNDSWRWSMAAADAGLVLSAGNERFHTLIYDREDRLVERLVGGRVQSRFEPHETPPRARPAIGLTSMPDGGLMAFDGRDARLVRMAWRERPRLIGTAPLGSIDVTLGASGELYASTEDGRVMRLPVGDAPQPDWEMDCDCELGGRLAASPSALYLSRPRSAEVATFNPEDGLRLRSYGWSPEAGLWPSDVEIAPDGRLHTADLVGASVQAWRRPEAPDAVWQAGLLAGPRRLASARWNEEIVVGAILADGYVELHEASRGRLLARWQPDLDGGSLDLVDLALGPEGEVYLADAGQRAVHVYMPGAGIPPTQPAEPSATPSPSPLTCRIEGDKVARPSTVVLGASTSVTLSLAAECPAGSRVVGADILLVIDRSASMRGQKLVAARSAAQAFAELLDVRHHRIGLVSFSEDARLDVSLTRDIGAIIDGLDGLVAGSDTNLADAIRTARAELESAGRAEALPVMILLTDGQYGVDDEDPLQLAADARAWGAQIYTIGLGPEAAGDDLRQIAGSAERYFHAPSPAELYPVYGQILREVLASLAGNLIIDDQLGGPLRYLAGSAKPPALEEGERLRWARSILPVSGITLSYQLEASAPGCHPTGLRAAAEYTDADGARRRFDFPLPTVCAITPTPTPTASPTPTATQTPVPRPIYLPLLNGCRSSATPVDVILLVDSSSSMAGQKLEDARRAAASFVELLDLRRDQAAVISFDAEPRLAAGLSQDAGALGRAIAGLQSGSGTRIDRALGAAVTELLGPRRKSGNQGVIVLLSDGAHNGDEAELRRAAAEARSLGSLIYAVGLGEDVDMGQLQRIAGPERSYFARDGEALEAIYRQIAAGIPCR